MPAPSCDATQPPTPITRSGFAALSARTRPRSWNTRSCAFSRTEQVLNRMTSASSARSVSVMPSAALSTSAMRSESYSFIWHPKVRMKSFLGKAWRPGAAGKTVGAAGDARGSDFTGEKVPVSWRGGLLSDARSDDLREIDHDLLRLLRRLDAADRDAQLHARRVEVGVQGPEVGTGAVEDGVLADAGHGLDLGVGLHLLHRGFPPANGPGGLARLEVDADRQVAAVLRERDLGRHRLPAVLELEAGGLLHVGLGHELGEI